MLRPNIRMMNRLRVQESSIQAAHVHKFPFQCLQYSNTSNITFLNEEESYIVLQHIRVSKTVITTDMISTLETTK